MNKQKILFVCGISGIIAAVFFRRNLGAEFHVLNSGGALSDYTEIPTSAIDWIRLFDASPISALFYSNFFDTINSILITILTAGMYLVLRKEDAYKMRVSLLASLGSSLLYIISTVTIPLLILSNHYYEVASPDQERVLKNVEDVLNYHNPGEIFSGIVPFLAVTLLMISGLITSLVQRYSGVFSKKVSTIGIIAHVLGLIYCFLVLFSTPLAAIPVSISAIFIITWYLLSGVQLLKIARSDR